MYQPYPASGQPAKPPLPPAPAPVRTAVKLMYAGAAASAAGLISGLALIIVDIKAAASGRFFGYSVATPQMRPLIITVFMLISLVVIALWLWMARANRQGRNGARIMSTVLFGLGTLQLHHPLPQGSPAGFGVTVLYYGVAALFIGSWLAGAAAVWLLWRPASTAFFKPQSFTQALPRQV